MHLWIVFLHAVSVLVFLLAHGASHTMAFRIQGERKPERLRMLLELSTSTYNVMFIALAFVFVLGIVAGFSGNWWRHGWIWAALGLLLVVSTAMYLLGQRSYGRLRTALGMPIFGAPAAASAASDEEIAALAAAARPMPIAIAGIGGLVVVLWLMLFKPF